MDVEAGKWSGKQLTTLLTPLVKDETLFTPSFLSRVRAHAHDRVFGVAEIAIQHIDTMVERLVKGGAKAEYNTMDGKNMAK